MGPHGILSTKARILVTNSVHYASEFDHIVYLRRGIVLESGPYAKLIADQDSELSKVMYVSLHHTPFIAHAADGDGNVFDRRGAGGSSSSGTSTPFTRVGSATPGENEGVSGTPIDDGTLTAEKIESLAERLTRKKSFSRAVLVKSPKTRQSRSSPANGAPNGTSNGTEAPNSTIITTARGTTITKEQSAQGRVKTSVYSQYIKAASKTGFGVFLLTIILSQAASILANVSLKMWGEENRELGGNSGRFIAAYGVFSLSSIVLNAAGAIAIWVLCALRSSKTMHDSVSLKLFLCCLSLVCLCCGMEADTFRCGDRCYIRL